MKPKLLFIFLLIALLPVIILAWMGMRLVNAERSDLERGLEKIYLGKLKDHDATIKKVIDSRKRELIKISANVRDSSRLPEVLRTLTEKTTSVSHFFVLDDKGTLIFPTETIPLSTDEKLFLQRTRKIWEGKLIPVPNGKQQRTEAGGLKPEARSQRSEIGDQMAMDNNLPNQGDQDKLTNGNVLNQSEEVQQQIIRNAPSFQQKQQIFQSGNDDRQQMQTVQQADVNTSDTIPFTNGVNNEGRLIPDSGWIGWFWESGIHLIYWIRLEDGRIFGAELDRADLIADIIAELPETDPFRKDVVSERIVLVDDSDKAVYQWGIFEPEKAAEPVAIYPLSFPLNTWRLKFYPGNSADAANFAKSSILNLIIMLTVLGTVFIFLAIYFYRENSREMREAAIKVSFVNRVSHELKTPLTNIRMYAELLNSQLEDAGAKEKKQLAVITGESERLSRLITNVLTFSKEQNGKLPIRRKEGIIDDIVKNTVDRLAPVLEQAGIELSTELNAGKSVNVDSDILEQILVNLLSNIEKYASSGKSANIATKQDGNIVYITVSDNGPGISAKFADSIFQPFYRIDNKLSEGTSGTGIGLNIARELARKHGGDIKLLPSEKGAVFEVSLDVAK